jgi:hypothetical protein
MWGFAADEENLIKQCLETTECGDWEKIQMSLEICHFSRVVLNSGGFKIQNIR